MASFAASRLTHQPSPTTQACIIVALLPIILHIFLWAMRVPHLGGEALLQVALPPNCSMHPLESLLIQQKDTFENICFTPAAEEGAAADAPTPFATVVTIQAGLSAQFKSMIRTNRLIYAVKQGYRYCEINELPDPTRRASWNKLAVALGLVLSGCSEYLFIVDADALIVGTAVRLQDLIAAHDPARRASMLISREYPRVGEPSHINMGVFLVAQRPGAADILSHVYNWHVNAHQHQEQRGFNDHLNAWMEQERRYGAAAADGAGTVGMDFSQPSNNVSAAVTPDRDAAARPTSATTSATPAVDAASAASGLLLVDHSVFNQHLEIYNRMPMEQRRRTFVVHWAGPHGGTDKLTVMRADIAEMQDLRRAVAVEAADAASPLCIGAPGIRIVQRSLGWRFVTWTSKRWAKSYLAFYRLGLWSKLEVLSVSSAVVARGQEPRRSAAQWRAAGKPEGARAGSPAALHRRSATQHSEPVLAWMRMQF
ncbi:hypothetical protein VaNZ11_008213 [Volvox africanus]|uniref:Nucleotide-diphospho-sugar transferase domain-containing protein n=1 Tax=Volvox africanus TaxID=51714 RepID=A0ABQ5S6E7_9CHLO|nr:hypothetical protein VaNZ11_008213 [Volvox africanus]